MDLNRDLLSEIRFCEDAARQKIAEAEAEAAAIMEAARNRAEQDLDKQRVRADEESQLALSEAEAAARAMIQKIPEQEAFASPDASSFEKAAQTVAERIVERLGHR